ncbi:hypothetical protein P4O66_006977 [Electrophorus voltai]|uniref:Acid sensing ion channel subunit family member 4 n=1 Tax=Electrophorus voltai TaxID=2609070 RepID=A0AAD9DYG4_9TELE|nr:hypothetical protein P4O66_006977 [Electrophorus voltai]
MPLEFVCKIKFTEEDEAKAGRPKGGGARASEECLSRPRGGVADLAAFASSSSLHGLSQVLGPPGSGRLGLKQVLWALALLASLAVFLYQASQSTTLYLEHPHLAALGGESRQELTFPAVTLCNVNRFRFSALTDADIYHLANLTGLPPKSRGGHRPGELQYPPPDMLDIFQRTGHQLEDMLKSCNFSGQNCSVQDFSVKPLVCSSPYGLTGVLGVRHCGPHVPAVRPSLILASLHGATGGEEPADRFWGGAVYGPGSDGAESCGEQPDQEDQYSEMDSPGSYDPYLDDRMGETEYGETEECSDVCLQSERDSVCEEEAPMEVEEYPHRDLPSHGDAKSSEPPAPKAPPRARCPGASWLTQAASREALLSNMDTLPPEARSSRAYAPTPKPRIGKKAVAPETGQSPLPSLVRDTSCQAGQSLTQPTNGGLAGVPSPFPGLLNVCGVHVPVPVTVYVPITLNVPVTLFLFVSVPVSVYVPVSVIVSVAVLPPAALLALARGGLSGPPTSPFAVGLGAAARTSLTGHSATYFASRQRQKTAVTDLQYAGDWSHDVVSPPTPPSMCVSDLQVYTRYGKCYTFNGNRTLAKRARAGGTGRGLELMLDVQQDEYLPIWRETNETTLEAGIRVQIHSQDEPPYIHQLGFGVSPGFQTFVSCQEQRLSYLPQPWGNCRASLDPVIPGYDTYSVSACKLHCESIQVQRECNCRLLHMPGHADVCTPTKAKCADRALALLEKSIRGLCSCETPCNVTRYGKELSMVKIPSRGSARYLSRKYHKTEEYIRDNFLVLDIYFEALNYETMEQKKAYDIAGLLGDIGGQMGLFIGASILTILEILDYIYEVVKSRIKAFQRPQKNQNQQIQRNQIQNQIKKTKNLQEQSLGPQMVSSSISTVRLEEVKAQLRFLLPVSSSARGLQKLLSSRASATSTGWRGMLDDA